MINTSRILQSTIIVAALLSYHNANASELHIKNDHTKEVEVLVESGTGTILPGSQQIRRVVKPGAEEVITVTRDVNNNEETFTVTGKVTIPSMNNKCKLLSVDKDYRIVFIESKMGAVICQYEGAR